MRFLVQFYRWENWGWERLSDHIKHSCEEWQNHDTTGNATLFCPMEHHTPIVPIIRLGPLFHFAVTLSRLLNPTSIPVESKSGFSETLMKCCGILSYCCYLISVNEKQLQNKGSCEKHLGPIGVKPTDVLVLASKSRATILNPQFYCLRGSSSQLPAWKSLHFLGAELK